VYFATRNVNPGYGTFNIELPDDKFAPGDIIKGCALGFPPNGFAICANAIAMPEQGLEYDFDVY
jgi:hypothetical protein